MSSTYVDGTTPLDAVHMNALQQKVEKGIANGYASLDANGKLAVAQTPLGYATTLPAAPIDGQEAVLVDNVNAPNYIWRFRYNAASTNAGGKWEFIGGTPYELFDGTAFAIPAAPAYGMAPAPRFTVPRAGVYLVETFVNAVGPLAGADTQVSQGPGTVADAGPARISQNAVWRGTLNVALVPIRNYEQVAAGAVFGVYLQSSAAGQSAAGRYLSVTPFCVS